MKILAKNVLRNSYLRYTFKTVCNLLRQLLLIFGFDVIRVFCAEFDFGKIYLQSIPYKKYKFSRISPKHAFKFFCITVRISAKSKYILQL